MRTLRQTTLTHLLAIVPALMFMRLASAGEVIFEEDFESADFEAPNHGFTDWQIVNALEDGPNEWDFSFGDDNYPDSPTFQWDVGIRTRRSSRETDPIPTDSYLVSKEIAAVGYKNITLKFGTFYWQTEDYKDAQPPSASVLIFFDGEEGYLSPEYRMSMWDYFGGRYSTRAGQAWVTLELPPNTWDKDFRLAFRAYALDGAGLDVWSIDNISITGEPCGDCEELDAPDNDDSTDDDSSPTTDDDDDDDSGCGGCVVGGEGGGASGGLVGLALMLVWIAGRRVGRRNRKCASR